jgi:hypothetical protein
VQQVPGVVAWLDDQHGEQAGDLVAGERDLARRVWPAGAFGGCGDGEERAGEHGEDDPAVPRSPSADLVLVQLGQPFAGLEVLLNPPLVMP